MSIKNQEKYKKLTTDRLIKEVPNDRELEIDILASLAFTPKEQSRIEFLSIEDFYSLDTKKIYTAFIDMYKSNKVIDISTVKKDTKKTTAYLILFNRNIAVLSSQLDLQIQRLKEISNSRRLQEISYKATIMIQEGEKFNNVRDWQTTQLESIEQGEQNIKTLYEEVDDKFVGNLLSEKSPSIKTGFSELDWNTGGITEGSLNIIGAAQGVGKTMMAINFIRYMCGSLKKNVLYVDVETNRKSMYEKIISRLTGYSYIEIKEGKKRKDNNWVKFNTGDWSIIHNARAEAKEYKFYYLGEREISTTDIKLRVKKIGGIDVVFVDYLQLLKPAISGKSIYEKTSNISRELKILSIELGIPFIVIASINRDYADRGDCRPHISDMRNSGQLEYDADLVLLLHRQTIFKEYDEKKDGDRRVFEHKMEVIIAKNRGGESNLTIDLFFNGNKSLITETIKDI